MFFFLLSALTLLFLPEQCGARSTTPPLTKPSGCTWNGQWYAGGTQFNPDPCTFCHCDNGQALCAVADCFFTQCVDAVHDPTQCCPVCPNGPNCLAPDGSIIKTGEEVTIGHTTCHCDPHGFMFSQHAVCTTAVEPVHHVDPVVVN